jgi:uncharacterized membrane protein
MADMNFYQDWLTSALFWLGVCITGFGAFLLIAPGYAINLSHKLNRWVSTDAFFQGLDRPVHSERFFYRWHRSFGIILITAAIYILYMLLLRTNVDSAAVLMPIFQEKIVNEWLYEALQYFFVSVSVFIVVIGFVMLVRPSALKGLEQKANSWFRSERSLQKLNDSYDIPENILPGNVRLFGTVVLAGGVYIMLSTSRLLF